MIPWRGPALAAGFGALVIAAVVRLDVDLSSVFSPKTIGAFGATAARLWPPRVDAATLSDVLGGTVETLSMSVVGTVVGGAIGLVLMPLCCETLFVRGPLVDEEERGASVHLGFFAVHQAARLVANVLRTIPYFAWALMFWFMVGPGVFAGALALAVHTGGVLGRTYSQAVDTVDARPSAALRATGARRTHVLLFGLLPEARAALLSLTLYRWEVNIRESAVLGLVGTAGLGFHLKYAIGTFDWKAAASHLLAMIVLVLAVDALSAEVRARVS